MKKLEFLNFQFSYQLKRKEFKESEYYSDDKMLSNKILYIIFLVSALVFTNNFEAFKNVSNYKVGAVLEKDVFSPKTVMFFDEIARKKIIDQILESEGKSLIEYVFINDIDKDVLENYDKFVTLLKQYKKNGELGDFKEFSDSSGIDVPVDILTLYAQLPNDDLNKKVKGGREILKNIYKKGVSQDENKVNVIIDHELDIQLNTTLSPEEKNLISYFIKPNYILDRDKTKNKIKNRISGIKKEKTKIMAGDLVFSTGKVLTENDLKYMSRIGLYTYRTILLKIFLNFIYLIGISIIFYYYNLTNSREFFLNKNKYRALFILYLILFLSYAFVSIDFRYFIPVNAFVFLGMILFSERFALSKGAFALLYALPLFNYDLKFLVVSTITLVILFVVIKKVQTRIELVHLGIKIGVLNALIYLILSYFATELHADEYFLAGKILVASSISGMITIALLPYFEKTFNIMTVFKLLELGDLSNPLLKEFSVVAPGSFQHSLMVATLSENAAEQVGANSIFARVASYYHDVGKMKRAHYYVENLSPGENPHKDLTPTMSTTIIKAHTKDGVEIGKKYGIQKEIRDIMLEHQGTTLIAYFYNRAKQEDENVNASDFRYPGPIPKSKESAIIMLADSIEAAVRSLDVKTQDNVDKMIRRIIASKIEEGQLTDADLTFREIEIIIQSFKKTLTSIHHLRIKYPDSEKDKKDKKDQ